jgi:8-oxo-dGTP pyrophosphatase MutT (NUDIX family)
MGARELHFYDRTLRPDKPASGSIRVSQLQRLRDRIKVAAVCYRLDRNGLEFLLVQTRGRGRWTFPKGSIEPGLTHAQSAALEAFEEAGVHGRMEESSFARYVHGGRGRKNSEAPAVFVNAHLCEVTWLGRPEESGRNPRWFSPEKARRRLQEDRAPEFAADMCRVVDRAVSRIRRLRSPEIQADDALRGVRFEAFDGPSSYSRLHAEFSQYIRHAHGDEQASSGVMAIRAQLSKVLQFVAPEGTSEKVSLILGDDRRIAPAASGAVASLSPALDPAGNGYIARKRETPTGMKMTSRKKRQGAIRKFAPRS